MLAEMTTQDVTTICNTVLGALTLISGIIASIVAYKAKTSANRAEDHGLANAAKLDKVQTQTNGMNTKMADMAGKLGFAAGQKDEKEAEAGRKFVDQNKGNNP